MSRAIWLLVVFVLVVTATPVFASDCATIAPLSTPHQAAWDAAVARVGLTVEPHNTDLIANLTSKSYAQPANDGLDMVGHVTTYTFEVRLFTRSGMEASATAGKIDGALSAALSKIRARAKSLVISTNAKAATVEINKPLRIGGAAPFTLRCIDEQAEVVGSVSAAGFQSADIPRTRINDRKVNVVLAPDVVPQGSGAPRRSDGGTIASDAFAPAVYEDDTRWARNVFFVMMGALLGVFLLAVLLLRRRRKVPPDGVLRHEAAPMPALEKPPSATATGLSPSRTEETPQVSLTGMGAWFEDYPLEFSREETQMAEKLLISAYPTNREALQLAMDVKLDVTALDQLAPPKYLWRDILTKASVAGRLAQLLSEVMRNADKAEVTWRLAVLHGGQAKLTAALFKKPSIAGLVLAPVDAVAPGKPAAALAGQLEQVINAAAGFADVPAFIRGLTAAQARTARVLVDGHPNGTGFLVGDDLLLTNWHVVANADGSRIQAQFDYYTGSQEGRKVKCANDWKVAHSPYVEGGELGADGPSQQVWDYALLRLAERVGAEGIGPDKKGETRKSYRLDGSAYAFKPEQPILIVGHPKTRALQLSYAAPSSAASTKHATRVRYQTNTEPGSSGSPVFDQEWRIVALHHAGGGPMTPAGPFSVANGAFNQGIPIAKIVEHMRANLTAADARALGI